MNKGAGQLAKRQQHLLHQESGGRLGINEDRPLAGVSVCISLQCFDIVGWATRRTTSQQQRLWDSSSKVLFYNKWRNKPNPRSLGNCSLKQT